MADGPLPTMWEGLGNLIARNMSNMKQLIGLYFRQFDEFIIKCIITILSQYCFYSINTEKMVNTMRILFLKQNINYYVGTKYSIKFSNNFLLAK